MWLRKHITPAIWYHNVAKFSHTFSLTLLPTLSTQGAAPKTWEGINQPLAWSHLPTNCHFSNWTRGSKCNSSWANRNRGSRKPGRDCKPKDKTTCPGIWRKWARSKSKSQRQQAKERPKQGLIPRRRLHWNQPQQAGQRPKQKDTCVSNNRKDNKRIFWTMIRLLAVVLLWIVTLLACELICGIVALVILYRNPCSNPRKNVFFI